ncbi:MAG: ABC transporter substrate-binding protein [Nocardioides sp.]
MQAGRHDQAASRPTSRRRRSPALLLGATAALASLVLAGCDAGTSAPAATPSPSPSSSAPTPLTFGVYGGRQVVGALRDVVDSFNATSTESHVTLRSWSGHQGLVEALRSGGAVPDVFMVSRGDLAWLREQRLTQPVDAMLDERGVDFGDDYSRDALQAFSDDNRLQCMPYTVSPEVIFLNKQLVDFDEMIAHGLDVPDVINGATRWGFDQFAAAAKYASRPRKGIAGVYVAPTLHGLAPFLYSGGGQLFDDDRAPTTLTLSDGATQAALARTLELLRNPHVSLSQAQLDKATPLQWFERGRLAMIEGSRDLVPVLRQLPGFYFDVMPMPVLNSSATVGDVAGLCVSRTTADAARAADFLTQVVSAHAVAQVSRTGYVLPANLDVALSDDFLQPDRMPVHSGVFTTAVRSMVVPPLLDSYPELEAAVHTSLQQLLDMPVLGDLTALTDEIDTESQAVLSPPSASPSPSS